MASQAIPDAVKQQVEETVAKFNRTVLNNPRLYYVTRYRGRFLYLDRFEYGEADPVCRLTYTGDMNDWEFAIFKYSTERYDPDEWFFPGIEHVDGTVEGALKAGLEAYPL